MYHDVPTGNSNPITIPSVAAERASLSVSSDFTNSFDPENRSHLRILWFLVLAQQKPKDILSVSVNKRGRNVINPHSARSLLIRLISTSAKRPWSGWSHRRVLQLALRAISVCSLSALCFMGKFLRCQPCCVHIITHQTTSVTLRDPCQQKQLRCQSPWLTGARPHQRKSEPNGTVFTSKIFFVSISQNGTKFLFEKKPRKMCK